jgi:predicted deacylase
MPHWSKKRKVAAVVGVLGICLVLYFLFSYERVVETVPVEPEEILSTETVTEIGRSVEDRPIEAYSFGSGDNHLLFVGGIHGGYEWNSVMLAYRFIDLLKGDPSLVPENIKITIVPVANPDGLFAVVGKAGRFFVEDTPDAVDQTGLGRFNARGVDLNRNFDCKWTPESQWRGQTVGAGTAAFSEPETAAIRDLVLSDRPDAAVFWHSQANTVYGSECSDGILPTTLDIMNAYATAAGYAAVPAFDAYAVTGDAEGWLASIGIPAITVELRTHLTVEWEQNLAGFKAVLAYFAK